MRNIAVLFLLILFAFSSCQSSNEQEEQSDTSAIQVAFNADKPVDQLDPYWYQGKAELSRYELSQNRYKDNHPGEVVMIFVTEDFLTDKQVKNDNYTNPNSIPILKNNIVKSFPTGIYTYNIMTSVFTPVNNAAYPMSLKVSNSSQEWCGQTYMQVNFNAKKKVYDYELKSYFENEADKKGQAKAVLMEEELFNRIRINPESLPTGKVDLLPSTEYTRLTHRPYTPAKAKLDLADYKDQDFSGNHLRVYTINYPDFGRTMEIVFENEPPFLIAGWRDTYPSMFDKQDRVTIAKRTHTILDAYWGHNSLADMDKRAALGLD